MRIRGAAARHSTLCIGLLHRCSSLSVIVKYEEMSYPKLMHLSELFVQLDALFTLLATKTYGTCTFRAERVRDASKV